MLKVEKMQEQPDAMLYKVQVVLFIVYEVIIMS